MSARERILALLPPPLTDAPDAVLGRMIDHLALQLDGVAEDLDRLRRTHWVNQAYRLTDLDKLANLVGVERFVWEDLRLFRARLLALVRALLDGALGPNEIKAFTLTYLRGVEASIDGLILSPGLARSNDTEAFAGAPPAGRPAYRPFRFVEWPRRRVRSASLGRLAGRVPYLHRWRETNAGLDETHPRFVIAGGMGGRTAVPMIVNLTTGEAIGYGGTVAFGQRLVIEAIGLDRTARATIDGVDVSDRLISYAGFEPGVAFELEDLDETPRLPRMARGANDWIFLIVGRYDLPALQRAFYAMAPADLTEGRFNESRYDKAVFPSGSRAKLTMSWDETEPASFRIEVPRGFTRAPQTLASRSEPPHRLVARALGLMVQRLKAAGVKARVEHVPFRERQQITSRFHSGFKRLDDERASPGRETRLEQGARFGETPLGGSRFE